jgi:hypothetical protein
MDHPSDVERPPAGPKTIRLTRAEAYALKLARPRKRSARFLVAGLLLAIILGSVLWLFQDWWLPWWLPESQSTDAPAAETAALPAAPAPAPAPLPSPSPSAAPAPAASGELTYLSAALWDHPDFVQAVRLFNHTLDRRRAAKGASVPPEELIAIGRDAAAAGRQFDALKPGAPAGVPLDAYVAAARRLTEDIRRQLSVQAARAAENSKPAEAPASDGTYKTLPDYREGARLFNQALEHFNHFKAHPDQLDRLDPAEDLARQAGQKFEAVKRRSAAADHAAIDRLIHQCYGLVSACRGARLREGDSPSTAAPAFDRGTAGPRRRPALPAYQPVP